MSLKFPKFALAAVAAAGLTAAPLAANAQDYHHDGGYGGYHHDNGGDRGYRNDRGYGDDRGYGGERGHGGIGAGGILLGLGIGALVGGAIVASQQPRYAPPPPVYYAPPPPAYYAPPPGDYSQY